MSPELDTLDQLQGEDLPLSIIRQIFEDDDRFVHSVLCMLDDREVLLLTADGAEIPRWQWPEVVAGSLKNPACASCLLYLTQKGAARVG